VGQFLRGQFLNWVCGKLVKSPGFPEKHPPATIKTTCSGRALGYTPAGKKLVRENPGLVEAIRRKVLGEKLPRPVSKAARRIRVRQLYPPHTYEVKVGDRSLFVKVTSRRKIGVESPRLLFESSQELDRFLAERGYKFNGFNVRVATYHGFYEDPKRSVFVTDFYGTGFKRGINFRLAENKMIQDILNDLNEEFQKRNRGCRLGDFVPYNTLYNPKTKTIIVFDFMVL